MDFVEICNVYVEKMIIKAAKRIFNSDKICRSYSDLNFGITFFGTQCRYHEVKHGNYFMYDVCTIVICEIVFTNMIMTAVSLRMICN